MQGLLRVTATILFLLCAVSTRAQSGMESGMEDRALDTMRLPSIGPEFLFGSAFPQNSNLQPITAYEAGARAYYPIASDFSIRLSASYRHLEIQQVTTVSSHSFSYNFIGDYFVIGPAFGYRWFEAGLDIGWPLAGNFETFGGTLADTSSSLGNSDMKPLVQLEATAKFPIVTTEGSELSFLFGGTYQLSSIVMTKNFVLHNPNSELPVATAGGSIGPLATLQIGLSWQFNIGRRDWDWK